MLAMLSPPSTHLPPPRSLQTPPALTPACSFRHPIFFSSPLSLPLITALLPLILRALLPMVSLMLLGMQPAASMPGYRHNWLDRVNIHQRLKTKLYNKSSPTYIEWFHMLKITKKPLPVRIASNNVFIMSTAGTAFLPSSSLS